MIPQDPVMLMSMVNMKLRDEYSSLEDLCASLNIDRQWLCKTLAEAGFEYDEPNRRFW